MDNRPLRRPQRPPRRTQRGHALLVALALILCLAVLVTATQFLVVQQLKATKSERDYERALQLAEAGVNAYLNMLVNPPAGVSVANRGLLPPFYIYGDILTISRFKQEVNNASSAVVPRANLIYYPPGQTKQCYFAYQTSANPTNSGKITVVAFGWSNGAVRRIQVRGQSRSVFDGAALYGLNDLDANDYAWRFTGNASIVGTSGAEGVFVGSSHVTFYDGPVVWANSSYLPPFNNADPVVYASANNVPPGHVGAPGLADPLSRHYPRKLKVETADEAANLVSRTTQGVDYFRSNNNNATGIRMLVRNDTTGAIRELSTPYAIPTQGSSAYQLTWPTEDDYTDAGMTASESALGLRVYPGDYYFTQITQSASDAIYYRTYNDADRTDSTVTPKLLAVIGDPANPNYGQASKRVIRFWIGHIGTSNDPASCASLSYQNYLEYARYASRFRIYVASNGGVNITGLDTNPPPPFRVNMLVYNYDGGAYHGDVTFTSSVYLYGSLIGWKITVGGSTIIEKEAPEVGPNDRIGFSVTAWKELQ